MTAYTHQQSPGKSAHIAITAIVPQVVAMTVVINMGGYISLSFMRHIGSSIRIAPEYGIESRVVAA